jgi:hypothetical protein
MCAAWYNTNYLFDIWVVRTKYYTWSRDLGHKVIIFRTSNNQIIIIIIIIPRVLFLPLWVLLLHVHVRVQYYNQWGELFKTREDTANTSVTIYTVYEVGTICISNNRPTNVVHLTLLPWLCGNWTITVAASVFWKVLTFFEFFFLEPHARSSQSTAYTPRTLLLCSVPYFILCKSHRMSNIPERQRRRWRLSRVFV